jgi:SAM-dependent methyltransferase
MWSETPFLWDAADQAEFIEGRPVTKNRRAWYERMLSDKIREGAYKEALRRYAPGRTVVDVGAGLGHLSLWALQAGAKRVIAIEHDKDAIAQWSNTLGTYGGSVTCVPSMSFDAEIGAVGDIVVAEVFDSSGVGEGAIETLRDARRFLRPGGIMIPSTMFLHVCLLYEPLPPPPGRLRYADIEDGSIGWYGWSPIEETGIHVQRSGAVYGFGLAFTAQLVPGLALTNLPGHPPTHWRQGAMPFGPIHVRAGQILIVRGHVSGSRDRLNPDVRFDILGVEGA